MATNHDIKDRRWAKKNTVEIAEWSGRTATNLVIHVLMDRVPTAG